MKFSKLAVGRKKDYCFKQVGNNVCVCHTIIMTFVFFFSLNFVLHIFFIDHLLPVMEGESVFQKYKRKGKEREREAGRQERWGGKRKEMEGRKDTSESKKKAGYFSMALKPLIKHG